MDCPQHPAPAGKAAPRQGQGWGHSRAGREPGTTEPEPLQGGISYLPAHEEAGPPRCLHPQLLLLCPILKTALSAAGPRKVTGFRFLFFPWKPSNRSWPHYGRFLGLWFFSAGLTMSHFLRRLREAPCAPLPLLRGGKSDPRRSGGGCCSCPAPPGGDSGREPPAHVGDTLGVTPEGLGGSPGSAKPHSPRWVVKLGAKRGPELPPGHSTDGRWL